MNTLTNRLVLAAAFSATTALATDPVLVGTNVGSTAHVFNAGTPVGTVTFDSDCDTGVRVATGDVLVSSGTPGIEIVAGAGPGRPAIVSVHRMTGERLFQFAPFGGHYSGGVQVATGDTNGDGAAELIIGGSHPDGLVHVVAVPTNNVLRAFSAFTGFSGPVNVAGGDVNNDGFDDIILGTGSGASHVKIFNGNTGTELRSFFAFSGFTGGVTIASGDVNNDGFADIIVGTATGTSHVKVFDGATQAELGSFFAFAPTFNGGVRVAATRAPDATADQIIVGAGSGGSGHVKIFDALSGAEVDSFFAFQGFSGGVFVAGGSVVVGGDAGIPNGHVKVFQAGGAESASFLSCEFGGGEGVRVSIIDEGIDVGHMSFASGPGVTPYVGTMELNAAGEPTIERVFTVEFASQNRSEGLNLAVADLNNDNRSDFVVAPGRCQAPLPVTILDGLTGEEIRSLFPIAGHTGEVRVAMGDITGDGITDIVAAQGSGGSIIRVVDGVTFTQALSITAFEPGVMGIHVALGDVNNDGRLDIIAGSDVGSPNAQVRVFSGIDGSEIRSFSAFPGSPGGARVASGDMNDDGHEDIVVSSGPGAVPLVRVIDGEDLSEQLAFNPRPVVGLTAGTRVAVGNVTGSDDLEIVVTFDGSRRGETQVFNSTTGAMITSFNATANLTSGVRTASADFNLDGVDDVVIAGGRGSLPHIKVIDGATNAELQSFLAFPDYTVNFAELESRSGAYVATADLTGDGVPDFVISQGPGTFGFVDVINGDTGELIRKAGLFPPFFTGGARVAIGHYNADAQPDIFITPGPSTTGPPPPPIVPVQNGLTGLGLGTVNISGFASGWHIAAGNVIGDDRDELLVAGRLASGINSYAVRIYNPVTSTVIQTIPVSGLTTPQEITVAVGKVNVETLPHILVGTRKTVRVYDVATGMLLDEYMPGGPSFGFGYAPTPTRRPTTPSCPADFNNDGNVDADDLGDYINCYFALPPCDRADVNNDGNVDADDLGDFINIYFGPPC